MVAQWWGALPPNPPGMSAANQAASVVIDFAARRQVRNPRVSHFSKDKG